MDDIQIICFSNPTLLCLLYFLINIYFTLLFFSISKNMYIVDPWKKYDFASFAIERLANCFGCDSQLLVFA
jgi:hypothetical protein